MFDASLKSARPYDGAPHHIDPVCLQRALSDRNCEIASRGSLAPYESLPPLDFDHCDKLPGESVCPPDLEKSVGSKQEDEREKRAEELNG